MEGGDHEDEVTQAVTPETTEKETTEVEATPAESSGVLTDSILDDDLVVIPSQTDLLKESEPAPEEPTSVVSSEPSLAVVPEPQAAKPPSEPSPAPAAGDHMAEPVVVEPPKPVIEPTLPQAVAPPQPNPEPSTSRPARPASATVRTATKPPAKPTKAIEDVDDEDEFEDETLAERLIGLTEMFPETLCTVAGVTFNLSVSGVKKVFNFSRSALWIGSTSFMVLILPIIFETEMVHMEQAQIQRQKQILLGPNAATAGGMTGGMTPPIPGVSVAAAPT